MLTGNANDLRDWKRQALGGMSPALSASSGPALARREFLKAALVGSAALAGAGRLMPAAADTPAGAVRTGTFYFPRLMFHVKDGKDIWNAYPMADVILRSRLVELTNINASREPVIVRLADLERMCRYPFIFATSEGDFDIPPNEEANLREFLHRGGFMHFDDCVIGRTGDRFFQACIRLLKKFFPDHEVKRVPDEHEIYHCYFDFEKGCPHLQGKEHGGWGLFEKGTGRIMAFVTPGDLHCGWTRQFFSARQNEQAIKMGINIIIYYLTH